jgi:hypothetical protein
LWLKWWNGYLASTRPSLSSNHSTIKKVAGRDPKKKRSLTIGSEFSVLLKTDTKDALIIRDVFTIYDNIRHVSMQGN